MKNREIFKNALKLLGGEFDRDLLKEYTIRAPYILGGFIYENCVLDDRHRELLGCGVRKYTHTVYADLALDFPFVKRFEDAAEYYMAAILVFEDDEELSDKFYDLYIKEISAIISEIPLFSDVAIAIR